jgi:hypothetical protein
LTGKAARATKTGPMTASFRPAKNQSAARESVSQKFSTDEEVPNRPNEYFKREFEFGNAPR